MQARLQAALEVLGLETQVSAQALSDALQGLPEPGSMTSHENVSYPSSMRSQCGGSLALQPAIQWSAMLLDTDGWRQ
eukprot:5753903-Lingulodinium_polyedra.AAC.1